MTSTQNASARNRAPLATLLVSASVSIVFGCSLESPNIEEPQQWAVCSMEQGEIIDSHEELDEKIGQWITVTGTAYSCKANAAVCFSEEGSGIQLDLEKWPPDVDGSLVRVTGILEQRGGFPNGEIPEHLRFAQMTSGGPSLIIRCAKWETIAE